MEYNIYDNNYDMTDYFTPCACAQGNNRMSAAVMNVATWPSKQA